MTNITEILLGIPGIVVAIGFHEAAHAFVAYQLGDNTARNEGRLSINPMSHIDPIGLLCLLLFRFGWAKPVPVNANNFKNPKKGMFLTALAGPVMNVLVAFVFSLILSIAEVTNIIGNSKLLIILFTMMLYTVSINVGLAVFNLIPVPPLDGSKIFAGLLPNKYYYKIVEHNNLIQIILLVLIFSRLLGRIIAPIQGFVTGIISYVAYVIVHGIYSLFI